MADIDIAPWRRYLAAVDVWVKAVARGDDRRAAIAKRVMDRELWKGPPPGRSPGSRPNRAGKPPD
jgi:hypothetical protein